MDRGGILEKIFFNPTKCILKAPLQQNKETVGIQLFFICERVTTVGSINILQYPKDQTTRQHSPQQMLTVTVLHSQSILLINTVMCTVDYVVN